MMRMIALLVLVAISMPRTGADQASPVQNPILSQIQGGTGDGTASGGNSGGVFAIGFGGGNGDSLANQLQQDILAAPPKQKAQTAQDLGAYHIPLPGPAPSFDAALKTLDPTDQESLFGELSTDLATPAPGPASQAASQNTDTVGFGTGSGATSSSGSSRKLK